MNTIFDIEQKQNSQELLDYAAGKPTNNFLFANEFNLLTNDAKQLALDNLKIDFTWSDKEKWTSLICANGINKKQLLGVKISSDWVFNRTDEVTLIIERYKRKRKIRTLATTIGDITMQANQRKESGFRQPKFPDTSNPNRPSEVALTELKSILDFGQDLYFTSNIRKASGMLKTKNPLSSSVYLRFKIRIKIGRKIFISKPLGIIQMLCKYHSIGDQRIITYKLR